MPKVDFAESVVDTSPALLATEGRANPKAPPGRRTVRRLNGPPPSVAGVTGAFQLVNDGAGVSATDGCEPFTLAAGAIALVDRGNCEFQLKTQNAQNAGAAAVVVVNNVAGPPITMGGTNPAIVIPAVMVSLDDGTTIKAGLPATGARSLAGDPGSLLP